MSPARDSSDGSPDHRRSQETWRYESRRCGRTSRRFPARSSEQSLGSQDRSSARRCEEHVSPDQGGDQRSIPKPPVVLDPIHPPRPLLVRFGTGSAGRAATSLMNCFAGRNEPRLPSRFGGAARQIDLFMIQKKAFIEEPDLTQHLAAQRHRGADHEIDAAQCAVIPFAQRRAVGVFPERRQFTPRARTQKRSCPRVELADGVTLNRAVGIVNPRTGDTAAWMRVQKADDLAQSAGFELGVRIQQIDVGQRCRFDRAIAAGGKAEVGTVLEDRHLRAVARAQEVYGTVGGAVVGNDDTRFYILRQNGVDRRSDSFTIVPANQDDVDASAHAVARLPRCCKYGQIKRSISPSKTACVFPVSTPVRWSFTREYGCST